MAYMKLKFTLFLFVFLTENKFRGWGWGYYREGVCRYSRRYKKGETFKARLAPWAYKEPLFT